MIFPVAPPISGSAKFFVSCNNESSFSRASASDIMVNSLSSKGNIQLRALAFPLPPWFSITLAFSDVCFIASDEMRFESSVEWSSKSIIFNLSVR